MASLLICATALGAQSEELTASNPGVGDGFGGSVSVSGDTVVVGAVGEDSGATGVNGDQADNSHASAGAAYVFVRNGSTWTQQAYLKASNTDPGDLFGIAVAISGDTIVVGARDEDSPSTGIDGDQGNPGFGDPLSFDKGAVYVFVRSGTTWSQQAYIKPSNGGRHFGESVSLSGDTLLVGATAEDSPATGVDGDEGATGAPNAGAAYVFVRAGGLWTQQAYLKASNTDAGDLFGHSVAVSGDTLIVGASEEQSAATGVNGNQDDDSELWAGAAYVFRRSGSTWTQEAYLKGSNNQGGDKFGWAVAAAGDTIVVSARHEDGSAPGVNNDEIDENASSAGAAYVFVRNGGSWSQQAYLKASNPELVDDFGQSVAAWGDAVLVGAFQEDSPAVTVNGLQGNAPGSDNGAAYLYVRQGTSWSQHSYLKAANPGLLGYGVALSADIALAGAADAAGAAYVFDASDLSPGPWLGLTFSVSGVKGHPQLVGVGTLEGGDPVTLQLMNAKSLGTVALFVGFSQLSAPFKGGTLVPFPNLIVPGLVTNGLGALTLTTTWPPSVPAGFELWIQAWIADAFGPHGFAASNAVKATAQ